jgi:hypothetical protein
MSAFSWEKGSEDRHYASGVFMLLVVRKRADERWEWGLSVRSFASVLGQWYDGTEDTLDVAKAKAENAARRVFAEMPEARWFGISTA